MVAMERVFGERIGSILDEFTGKIRQINQKYAKPTIKLSRGQRKRLALLTAYLEDRPVYVFDEWAADQDPVFRKVFYLRLLPELKRRGKTVVAITHDDRYFASADRIVKLEEGKVVETFRHESLQEAQLENP